MHYQMSRTSNFAVNNMQMVYVNYAHTATMVLNKSFRFVYSEKFNNEIGIILWLEDLNM